MMFNLKKTLVLIEYLSSEMINKLNEKDDVVDLEVMQVSEMLNNALSHYVYLINRETKISIKVGAEASQ